MRKMSLQWRITILTTLFIAIICGCLTLFVYKNGVYYIDLLQDTVDAKSDQGNGKEPDEIYINIPDDKWNDFADDFSIQVYNNKADYKKSSLMFSTLLALLGGVVIVYLNRKIISKIIPFIIRNINIYFIWFLTITLIAFSINCILQQINIIYTILINKQGKTSAYNCNKQRSEDRNPPLK